MKKILLTLGLAVMLSAGGAAMAAPAAYRSNPEVNIGEKLALYIPNRLIDALDLFSVNLGVGPIVEIQMMGTRAVWGGAGIGMAWKAYKGYNRQYGFGTEQGWYWSFVVVSGEEYGVVNNTSLVKKYFEHRDGFPTPDRWPYNYFDGARDYWQIGGSLGCLVTGDLYIHPVEWFDFALGFLLIDVKGDDLTFDDFR